MSISPSFYLKTLVGEESIIYMGIKLSKGSLFKYYTKCKVIPELFDKATKRAVVDNSQLREYKKFDSNIVVKQKSINTILSNLENDTKSAIDSILRNEKIVTKELLKLRLDEIYKPQKVSEQVVSFLNYLDAFITKIEIGERLHKGKRYGAGTIRTYNTFRTLIFSYNKRISFSDIDMQFYDSFIDFLNQRNYTPNSVGKAIKMVKVIMRDAFEAGLHTNMVFSFKGFETLSESIEEVYLSNEELDRLLTIDLSTKPNYELARDVFICGCYTALRFSDYSRIKPHHIKNKGNYSTLEINTMKTNTLVKIPLKPLVLDILKKYNYDLPKTYEQKVNKYLKEICKLVKIDEEIEITATNGGVIKTYRKPKYELIKTHTARRTGATLLYLAGIPPIDIMKITGHTKEANLLKYIRITKEQTAERLSNNIFFQ